MSFDKRNEAQKKSRKEETNQKSEINLDEFITKRKPAENKSQKYLKQQKEKE